jgi:hypothetical protein
MEQSKDNNCSAIKEVSRVIWNPKFHYRVQNSPWPTLILSQMKLLHMILSHFFKMTFIIILTSMPTSSGWSLSFMFSYKTLFVVLIASIDALTCPSHLILLYWTSVMIFGEKNKLCSSLLWSFLQQCILFERPVALVNTFCFVHVRYVQCNLQMQLRRLLVESRHSSFFHANSRHASAMQGLHQVSMMCKPLHYTAIQYSP